MSAAANAKLADLRGILQGEPAYLAGSLCAEIAYDLHDAHSDVDVFTPSGNALIAMGQKLIDNGYQLDSRFERVWYRWIHYGFKKWHTNSLRLHSPAGVETNLVYKLVDGHPTTSLSQVLESFDFGLLGVGYDFEQDQWMDMRPSLFPNHAPDGPLPMMPSKRANWRQGFISQYNGLREMGRYAKYHGYGHDLSLVKDDLVEGYRQAGFFFGDKFEPEKQALGKIYERIAYLMANDMIDEMVEASKEIDYADDLDKIMEALE